MTTVFAETKAAGSRPRRRKRVPSDEGVSQTSPALSAADLEYKNALQHPAVTIALRNLERVQTLRDSVQRKLSGGSDSVTVEELVELEDRVGDAQKVLAEIARRMPVLERHPFFLAALSQNWESTMSGNSPEIISQKIVFYFEIDQRMTQSLMEGFRSTLESLFGRSIAQFEGSKVDGWNTAALASDHSGWAFELESEDEIEDAVARSFHALVLDHLKEAVSPDVKFKKAERTTTMEKVEQFLIEPTISARPRM